ncbi:sulfatase [Mariniblastus sp.]|nr:sulfatase [Mariniblastus sp.]
MNSLPRLIAAFLLQSVAFLLISQTTNADDGAISSKIKKPNFVIIMTDDQGYQDLGCYGSPNIKTPRIDQMAKEGMKFTGFYAQTVCGPARTSLMTGCYPLRTERADHDNVRVPHPAMALNEVTIPEILKPLGYKTGMMGKWDLSGRNSRGNKLFRANLGPSSQGFDYSFWSATSDTKVIREGENVVKKKFARPTVTKLFTDKAINFIDQNKEEPFFVYLAHPMPHAPIAASKQFKGKSKAGLYGDVIEELDFHIGRVLDRIEALGLSDNTYVIFTSDNGPWLNQGKSAGHAAPLRSGKTSTYDGGLRVPFIIKAPGKIAAGTTSDQVCAGIDLLPTIAELAGATIPKDRVIDGVDISGIFLGKQSELDRAYFFYQHQSLRAVREGDWKLHLPHTKLDRTKEGKIWQSHVPEADRAYIDTPTLYNLKDDIGETTDVAKEHPEIVAKLTKQLEFAKRDIGFHDVIGENSRRTK